MPGREAPSARRARSRSAYDTRPALLLVLRRNVRQLFGEHRIDADQAAPSCRGAQGRVEDEEERFSFPGSWRELGILCSPYSCCSCLVGGFHFRPRASSAQTDEDRTSLRTRNPSCGPSSRGSPGTWREDAAGRRTCARFGDRQGGPLPERTAPLPEGARCGDSEGATRFSD